MKYVIKVIPETGEHRQFHVAVPDDGLKRFEEALKGICADYHDFQLAANYLSDSINRAVSR